MGPASAMKFYVQYRTRNQYSAALASEAWAADTRQGHHSQALPIDAGNADATRNSSPLSLLRTEASPISR